MYDDQSDGVCASQMIILVDPSTVVVLERIVVKMDNGVLLDTHQGLWS